MRSIRLIKTPPEFGSREWQAGLDGVYGKGNVEWDEENRTLWIKYREEPYDFRTKPSSRQKSAHRKKRDVPLTKWDRRLSRAMRKKTVAAEFV